MYTQKTLWIWFSLLFTNRQGQFAQLLKKTGSITELYNLINQKPQLIDKLQAHSSLPCTLSQAQDIEKFCNENNIHILTQDDFHFPNILLQTDSAPIILYAMGDLTLLNENIPHAAIIGTRKAVNYSLKVCKNFSRKLSENGYCITSGFANGIDHCAHESCLDAGGKTIAVLGCGILYDYPMGSDNFKKRLSNNGLLISEYPPLEKPAKENFVIRNRLIAAYSDLILVIQAGEKSGALNTVNHGLDYGKDIYVIPPADIYAERYKGQVMLLNDGANIICSAEDLLEK